MKKFEYFDVTADIGFYAYGNNLNEAFENATFTLAIERGFIVNVSFFCPVYDPFPFIVTTALPALILDE